MSGLGSETAAVRARAPMDWLFRNRETGRYTVAQLPNVALGLYLMTVVVRRLVEPAGTVGTVIRVVGVAALVWWAVDEIARGVNPFRRLLGTVVLVGTVVGLVSR